MDGIIPQKQQNLLVRFSPDLPFFTKCNPVLIRPKVAVDLIQSDLVLVHSHLCLKRNAQG